LRPDAVPNALPASYIGFQLDGRYRLDRLIGEGASAWVFAGHDLRLEREVAIKLLKPSVRDAYAGQASRFVTEGRTLAKLVHPHVVLVYDAGETPEGVAYLVMELSGAENLEAELLHRGRLSMDETLSLLLPLLGALACAHDRGIIHRDIKPANIAVVREHAKVRAKLLDFGIAKQGDVRESTERTIGTPSYMAPEQARGEPLSPAADVWALGVVFFRCLVGRLPFEADTTTGMLTRLVCERAPWFAEACPGLPRLLALTLDRALEPQPTRRYADMRSFAQALASACAQEGIELHKQPEPLGLPRFQDWLDRASFESTRTLSESQRAVVIKGLSVGSRLPVERGRAWLFLAPFAVAACAWAISDKSLSSVRAAQTLPAKVARSVASPLPEASPAPPLAALSERAPMLAPRASVAEAIAPVAAARETRRSPRRAPKLDTAPPSSRSEPVPAPQLTEPKPALITTWSLE
jgi:serine/threonine protein kinase